MAEASGTDGPSLIPKRVLIVRTGAIGDVTNALVLAEALKATGQISQLGWVVHPLCVPLVKNHPAVDRVHIIQRKGGLKGWLRLRRELRAENYDLAIDAQRILKSAILSRMSGASRSLGFDSARSKEGSWLFHSQRIVPSGGTHMVDWYLEFAEALGLKDPKPRRRLPVDPTAESWATDLVENLNSVSKSNVAPLCVHIGATKVANRWDPERYGELMLRLQEKGLGPVVLTGGSGDRMDADQALKVAQPDQDLVGHTSLPQLISLLRRCRVWVGCDTGPMHLAAALNCPVVAFFGPSDPARTGPYGEGHQVLGRQPGGEPVAMDEIPVDRILDAARRACTA